MTNDRDQALAGNVSITIDGAELPPEARGMLARVTAETSIDRASTFAIELNNWDQGTQKVRWSDDAVFKPGGVVEISLGYADSLTKVLAGEITGLVLSFPPEARSLLVVRGYDRLHRFRRGRRTRSYLQAKDSDV